MARRRKSAGPLGAAGAVVVALAVALVLLLQNINRAAPAANQDNVSVWFSPKGGCTEAIVQQLGQAQTSVDVQAYSFTSDAIAQALVSAHQRGVKVRVVLDSENRTAQYSAATFLMNHRIPVFIDGRHAIAHNKIMLIDGRTVLTGSFNFTKAAENSNAENLLLIQDKPQLFSAYQRNFQEHLNHSEEYTGPEEKKPGAERRR